MTSNVVTLDRGNYTTCTVNLHGGYVTSWRMNNKEQVFVSKLSLFSEENFIRGGIGLTFPTCGPWEFGPDNGFSRLIQWFVDSPPRRLLNDDIEATFKAVADDFTRSMWNYDFEITNMITLKLNELQFDISVMNTSQYFPFSMQIMMQTHIKVPDITKCEVGGLDGSYYRELGFTNPEKFPQTEPTVRFTEYINRCYENTPDEVTVTNVAADKVLRLRKKNFPELIIWNPWEEDGKMLDNFDVGEFMKMVTVEASNIGKAIRLEPQQEFKGQLQLEICDESAE